MKTLNMAELNNSSGKKSKSHSLKDRSTRVDLTPMVDLGFLLITFFVFTTSMSEAKAMDMTETKNGDSTNVANSGAMTILLGNNHNIFYYHGKEDAAMQKLAGSANMKEIRSLILKKKHATDLGNLMFIIKSDSTATFGDNINLLDEFVICGIPKGHYAEGELTEHERSRMTSRY